MRTTATAACMCVVCSGCERLVVLMLTVSLPLAAAACTVVMVLCYKLERASSADSSRAVAVNL